MNFIADEGVEREIVDGLRAQGHEVLYVAEMSPAINDAEVLDLANKASSILITSDKDFGELVFRQQRIHQGVILIRLHGQSSQTKATTLAATVTDHSERAILWVPAILESGEEAARDLHSRSSHLFERDRAQTLNAVRPRCSRCKRIHAPGRRAPLLSRSGSR